MEVATFDTDAIAAERLAGLEYQRQFEDTVTWLAEVLDGSMRSSFEFQFDGQELYSQDGRGLNKIFHDAVTDANRLARREPSLHFEQRRRRLELDEYREMLAMAQGDRPNTMVVVSDFPPELTGATRDVGGYNVTRRQTMLRVISRQTDGSIRIQSQSLDHSNRTGLEAIYHYCEAEPNEGELLGQRLHAELADTEQERLIDRLMSVYDQTMADQYGGSWYAGREQADRRNTYDFAAGQGDLIDAFLTQQAARPLAADQLRYNLAAAIEKRFDKRFEINVVEAISRYRAPRQAAMIEMSTAGEEAKVSGKSFSGCGITASATSEQNDETTLSALGYGNKVGSGEDKYGSLTFKCPKGHPNTRPYGKLIPKCTTCGTSVKC